MPFTHLSHFRMFRQEKIVLISQSLLFLILPSGEKVISLDRSGSSICTVQLPNNNVSPSEAKAD